MLHILNGDAAAELVRHSDVGGVVVPWRESLMTGPTPEGLPLTQWIDIRTKHLSEAYEADPDHCRYDLQRQIESLHSFIDHEEVILWFDRDLFCQVNLWYLLHWFSTRKHESVRLSIVGLEKHPDLHLQSGIGSLDSKSMRAFFDQRTPLTDAHLALGSRAWIAYCSPDPMTLERAVDFNTSALPFVKDVLLRHLERFPSTRNGLGRIENRILELLSTGCVSFNEVYEGISNNDTDGLGDYQCWAELKRLAGGATPALKMVGLEKETFPLRSGRFREASFQLTHFGKALFKREADWIEINGIDHWLGGVHLNRKNGIWRWDEEGRFLLRT
ncbi:MAG: hypothetical protein ACKVRP_13415 [Bacteroidota bacterium]